MAWLRRAKLGGQLPALASSNGQASTRLDAAKISAGGVIAGCSKLWKHLVLKRGLSGPRETGEAL